MAKLTQRRDLTRLLRPRSVAIVGLNDRTTLSDVDSLINHPDLVVHLVHPSRPTLHGRDTARSLEAIGQPVDVVVSLVSAARTSKVVAEARAIDAGGAVIIAAGFREAGEEGQERERELVSAAGDDFPCLGPNCFGYVDATRRVDLALQSTLPPGAGSGSIGLVSHTGGMIPALITAGLDRNIGFSYAISTGNELNVDLVDCLNFLIDDSSTRVIGLIVESIKRPHAFFEAASRAMRNGKPIVALKLGRSARSVAMVKSHTGSVAGDPWVYQAAFRQYGISAANDLTELLDKLAGFEQLPASHWQRADAVAILTPTGGGASLASDVCSDFEITLPEMNSIRTAMPGILGSAEVLNPLDTTGFVFADPEISTKLAATYAQASEARMLMFQWHLQDQLVSTAKPFIDELVRQCAQHDKPLILSGADDGHIESAALELTKHKVVLARGPVAAARALRAMSDFTRAQSRLETVERPPAGDRIPPPTGRDIVASDAGPMLTFQAAMSLLGAAGINVAPYVIVQAGQSAIDLPSGERFVAKLADVPHRTDIGAVRLNLARADVRAAVDELRNVARERGLSQAVAIQPQLVSDGEAFVGLDTHSSLGPMVICGLGGIYVEVLKRFCGVIAPFSPDDARNALLELADLGIFTGVRGARPWDRDRLASAMVAVAQLAHGGQDWITSLDINPLALTSGGLIALDALCLVKDSTEVGKK